MQEMKTRALYSYNTQYVRNSSHNSPHMLTMAFQSLSKLFIYGETRV
jgi:hypothetical protein